MPATSLAWAEAKPLFKIINKKRVIYFDDFENIDDLIDYILELDKNEEKYNEILNEKIFVREDINLENYNNFIQKNEFLDRYLNLEQDC